MKFLFRWFVIVPMLLSLMLCSVVSIGIIWLIQIVYAKIKHQDVYLFMLPTMRATAQRIYSIVSPE